MNITTFIVKHENEIQPMEFCIDNRDNDMIGDPDSGITFLSREEIIQDIDRALNQEDKAELLADYTVNEHIPLWHMSLGMWVRNSYGLWEPSNPIIKDAHPDDVSMDIIQSYCMQEIQKTVDSSESNVDSDSFDDAMKVLE